MNDIQQTKEVIAAYKKFRQAFAEQVMGVAKNPVNGQFQVSIAKMSAAHDKMIDALDKLKGTGE